MHEAAMHDEACFVTLTYAPHYLPKDGSLQIRDFQLFLKRLRKKARRKVSYFHCGEYGDIEGRPHYHAALFGLDFLDQAEELPKTQKGFKQWTAPLLRDTWKLGHVAAMHLTFESAQYLANYITNKVTGDLAKEHYQGRTPEYSSMSKRPAIGKRWFDQYKDDVYPLDEVVVRGVKTKPPKYYDQLLGEENEELLEKIKSRRREKADTEKRQKDQTRDRRATKEELLRLRQRKNKREIT